jgi:DNA-binding transcriptional ArsR family regulator
MAIPSLHELESLHQNICQAVGDPKRIQIMYALYDKPRYVTELGEALDMPQPTISRHLALLKQRALVTSERDGAAVIYRLTDDRIIRVLDIMRQLNRDLLERQAAAFD